MREAITDCCVSRSLCNCTLSFSNCRTVQEFERANSWTVRGRKNEVCQSASEYFLPQATANLRPRKQNHRQEPHRPALNRGDRVLVGGEATAEATRDDRSHPRHQSLGFESPDHLQRRLMTECVTSCRQPHAKPLEVKGERGQPGCPRNLPGKQCARSNVGWANDRQYASA